MSHLIKAETKMQLAVSNELSKQKLTSAIILPLASYFTYFLWMYCLSKCFSQTYCDELNCFMPGIAACHFLRRSTFVGALKTEHFNLTLLYPVLHFGTQHGFVIVVNQYDHDMSPVQRECSLWLCF